MITPKEKNPFLNPYSLHLAQFHIEAHIHTRGPARAGLRFWVNSVMAGVTLIILDHPNVQLADLFQI